MIQRVTIRTGARLHFGPLSYVPERGRHFGGIGLMIDEPGFEVEVTFNLRGLVTDTAGPAEMRLLRRWRDWSPHRELPPVRIQTNREIPRHQGLGSGTQRALAVAEALSRLAGETEVDIPRLALQMGRGERSAVGIHGYQRGGFIVDAGHRAEGDDIGALAARVDMPPAWRVVLLTPRDLEAVAGASEFQKFEQLAPMPERTTGRLCRLVLTEILPALNASDHARFAAALGEYGKLAGEFFAPVQGGAFRSPVIEAIGRVLAGRREYALAQSSWGPSAAAMCKGQEFADELVQRLQASAVFRKIAVRQVAPLNRGRECCVES